MRVVGTQIGTITEAQAARSTTDKSHETEAAEGAGAVVVAPKTSEISARVSESEASRMQRIEEVRRAIAAGRYRVDLDRLAERIADDELVRAGRA